MRHNFNLLVRGIALCAAFIFFAGCAQEDTLKPLDDQLIQPRGPGLTGSGAVKTFYALTDQNQLIKYQPGPPVKNLGLTPLTGLATDEVMLAIDFRPATGKMYGVTNLNLLYVIDHSTGLAKVISREPFEPSIKGSYVGFDFDPLLDQIRIVTDEDQNMRLDPNIGNVANVDTDINPALNGVTGIAYARIPVNRVFTLYDIDPIRGALYRQNPQNGGTLVFIGSLGLAISGESGFDIASSGNIALAALYGHSLLPGGAIGDNLSIDAHRVYEINLSSGKATYRGKLDRGIIGLAIP